MKVNKELRELGRYGEKKALDFLENNGYEILDMNFYCNQGEIDIIAQKDKEIIFCEVKTRRNKKFGNPKDAVDFNKKKHMWYSAKYFLYKNDLMDRYIRFDVIEVFINKDKMFINHIKNIM